MYIYIYIYIYYTVARILLRRKDFSLPTESTDSILPSPPPPFIGPMTSCPDDWVSDLPFLRPLIIIYCTLSSDLRNFAIRRAVDVIFVWTCCKPNRHPYLSSLNICQHKTNDPSRRKRIPFDCDQLKAIPFSP